MRAALAGATHVLSTVPPHSTGMDPVLAEFGDDLWGASGLQWAGYLSSTSVYADAGGGLVDETFETTPASPAGRARLAAEEGWRGRADVLRLAGVYGPGRSALATLSRDAGAMTRAEEAGDKLVSRVFVDDVVRAVAAAASAGREAAVYNVADDMPASRKAVFTCAARLLASAGVQPGEEGGEEGIGGQRYRFRTSKSVVNKRMKEELGVTLQFPTYMHGLAHLAVLEGLLGEGVVSS